MKESKHRKEDIRLRWIIFGMTFILAIAAWVKYEDTRKKEFQKVYYEQRIETINKVFEIISSIDRAKTDKDKLKASTHYWSIHYGYSIPYLNGELFSALEPISIYINKCIQKFETAKNSTINCELSIMQYLPLFAIKARHELAKGWDIDFEEISEDHPWHGIKKI